MLSPGLQVPRPTLSPLQQQRGLQLTAARPASAACLFRRPTAFLQKDTVQTTAVTRGQNRELFPVGVQWLLLYDDSGDDAAWRFDSSREPAEGWHWLIHCHNGPLQVDSPSEKKRKLRVVSDVHSWQNYDQVSLLQSFIQYQIFQRLK